MMQHTLEEIPITETTVKTLAELTTLALEFSQSKGWLGRVRLDTEERWYERLYESEAYDVWAISWMPGQSTGFHDHGDSSGAFVVVTGALEEHRPGKQALTILPGETRAFDRDYAHDVRNASLGPAVSIHVYSPPLTEMNEYEVENGRLVPQQQMSARTAALAEARQLPHSEKAAGSNIDKLLAAKRSQLHRLTAREAFKAWLHGDAILVDIRPEAQRATEGRVPGALIVERNVLEWRLDPKSSARLPEADSYHLQVIVFCSEGYTSSLAAAALQDLGLWRSTDIIGGFQAWRAGGLPLR